jgi:sulfite reductase alpha subunit-like flavoprotein
VFRLFRVKNMPELCIVYGSQTGNAKEIAGQIARMAWLRRYSVELFSMHELPLKDLPAKSVVIFLASTTGDGDPPETMQKFWNFLLRKHLSRDALANVRIAVLGLGDSGYPKYNVVARKLHARLIQLGAEEVNFLFKFVLLKMRIKLLLIFIFILDCPTWALR